MGKSGVVARENGLRTNRYGRFLDTDFGKGWELSIVIKVLSDDCDVLF